MIVTTVLAETAAVVMLTVDVKLNAGTVVVAGTLATAGLLLESDTRAPPSGALVLSTTVLFLTFGSGYELAVKTFEEGCHGDWVLKPEHLSGQIQRPPDL